MVRLWRIVSLDTEHRGIILQMKLALKQICNYPTYLKGGKLVHHSLETSFYHQNTFEERINDMINNKLALAEMIVSAGENRIGKLSNKELKDIFGT